MSNMSAPMSHGQVFVEGFTVVPVRLNEKSQAGHCLYIKEHAVRGQDTIKPRERTLFVLNVPSYCTEACLTRVFSSCGKVQNVYLHDEPSSGPPPCVTSKFFSNAIECTGFRVAYIVFNSAGSVKTACQLPHDKPLVLTTPETPIPTGLEKWCADYASEELDVTALQSEVDDYMTKFDSKVKQEKEKERKSKGVPDKDDWITVTHHTNTNVATKSSNNKQRGRKKRKEKELKNFYKFQIRDSKREHIATLRKKFEEDKQRIALMKAARKFKPY